MFNMQYTGLSAIYGSLVVLENVTNPPPANEEAVQITFPGGTKNGRVVRINEGEAVTLDVCRFADGAHVGAASARPSEVENNRTGGD